MRYPAFNEYQAALQNPSQCFESVDLQRCSVETDLWGLPRVRSGGFALTYKLTRDHSAYAVRCFHRHVDDRGERYRAINVFLSQTRLKFLENIQYIPKGIRIKGTWYPITCMKWVEGETLEAYIIRHLNDVDVLQNLCGDFRKIIVELEQNGIAHGDLSHHNIMIQDDHLFLVDYDGMFVPGMRQRKSCEIGNPHFQHPGRDENIFDLSTDRFSSIVIYLAIKSLIIDPRFWFKFETGGEGLLFKRSDFTDPYRSPLLQEMDALASLRRDVTLFRQICMSDVSLTPRLEEFIDGKINVLPHHEIAETPADETPPLVFDAQKKFLFSGHLGEMVSVVGKIEDTFFGKTKDDVPHVFLNLGDWRTKCFTIILWDDAMDMLENTGRLPEDYVDRWVKVTGMLTMYHRRPQIVVNTPFDIEVMEEEQAYDLLKKSGTTYLREIAQKPEVKPRNIPVSPPRIQKAVTDIPHSRPVQKEETHPVLHGKPNPLDLPQEMRGAINDLFGGKNPTPKKTDDDLDLP
jgi:hypothetical protein